MKKIMISIDENVLSRIDNYVEENGMNRSSFITMSCTDYLNARDQLPKVRDELAAQFNELLGAINEKLK